MVTIQRGAYSASSRAALGLQNRPVLSIFGNISFAGETESLDFSTTSSTTAKTGVSREPRGSRSPDLEFLEEHNFGSKEAHFLSSPEEDE